MKNIHALTRYCPIPAREQNLIISTSKHLYATKDELLRYQQKEIDPRLPGAKTLLTRFVLLDVDTGVAYCEVHPAPDGVDLLGFLARAWSDKPDHPMRGFPQKINVPKIAMADPEIVTDLKILQHFGGFEIDALPAGFAAGIHAVKKFEFYIRDMVYRSSHLSLYSIIEHSATISFFTSSEASCMSKEPWAAVDGPDTSFTQAIDDLYDPLGGWRLDEYEAVLNGIVNRKTD